MFKLKSYLSLSALLAFFLSFSLIGCGGKDSNNGASTTTITNAQIPVITVQPIGASYDRGASPADISVTASVTDNGTLSYQWYSNAANSNSGGTPIPTETASTYAPPTSTNGTTYYYVVITNTNTAVNGETTANVTSSTAEIVVNAIKYQVSFYDANLNLLESQNVTEGAITLSNIRAGTWYLAGGSNSEVSYNLTGDVNFYEVSDVHEIWTEDDLNAARDNLTHNYIMFDNITLNATLDTISGWLPIGNSSNRFAGIFNGNGNQITNLWINRTSADNVGLFGVIENAQIKNLTIKTAEGKEVKGKDYVGGIAGNVRSSSSVTNSHAVGNVNGTDYVGGIAGLVYDGSPVTNSYFTGNVSGTEYIGGIAGSVEPSSSVTNSHSTGNVSGDYCVGGIAGVVQSASITNSRSTGNVSGNERVGGIAGRVTSSSSVTNSYSAANVNGNDYVGGIAGRVESSSSVTNSYAVGNVSGDYYVGGIAGSVESSSSVTNSYAAGTISGITNQVGGIAGYVYSSTVQNNAAINPSVTGSTNVNRIVGDINNGAVTNNFALDEMSVIGSTSGNAGTSKAEGQLKMRSTYSDDVNGDGNGGLGWLFGNDADNPWRIDEILGYPYLYWQMRDL